MFRVEVPGSRARACFAVLTPLDGRVARETRQDPAAFSIRRQRIANPVGRMLKPEAGRLRRSPED